MCGRLVCSTRVGAGSVCGIFPLVPCTVGAYAWYLSHRGRRWPLGERKASMTRARIRVVMVAVFTLVLAALPAVATAATSTATIDFEPGLIEGNAVTSVSTGAGISGAPLTGSASVLATGGSGNAVVFDSSCGGIGCGFDPDLAGTTGNTLIVSTFETTPNDHAGGGMLSFNFAGLGPGTFKVVSIQVTDFGDDGAVGSIKVDGVDSANPLVAGADGNVQTVVVDKVGSTLVIATNDSYSIDNIVIEWETPDNPGTGTIGYWQQHPDAWPVGSITIGGVDYTKAEAIAAMRAPGRGDKSFDMFPQLVAAKLNVEIGNDASCIAADIAAADTWMTDNSLGSNVRARSDAWQDSGSGLHGRLDDYNNGRLCAPHRG